MMEFFIISGIGAFLGSAITGAWFKRDDLFITINGKKIAVLGARNTGKTTLFNYITTGTLTEKYNQTVIPEETKKRRFKLHGRDIKIKKSRDVGGSKDDYRQWKAQLVESDLVFYLVRADKLFNKDLDMEKRIEDDLHQIRLWIQESKSPPVVLIIGTHCDLDPNFKSIESNNRGDYVDRFKQLPSVRNMTLLASDARMVLGSLKNEQLADDLISQIFQQVLK
jgi:GTPase SAR1 family protein